MICGMRLTFALAAIALGLAACGGDDGEGASHPLGEEVVVEQAEAAGKKRATTLGITVLKVRKGSQQELKDAGFTLDPDEAARTPYYVDMRVDNQGSSPIEQRQGVSMEDDDGTSISSTIVIELGGEPFKLCPQDNNADFAPGASHERCLIFLVPEGNEPKRLSFLP